MTAKGPGISANLEQRTFNAYPEVFHLWESEIDAFLEAERRYATFLKPLNKHKSRKSRQKDGARKYTKKESTMFEATFESYCSCAGFYRDRRDPDLSPVKKRITGGASSSYKSDCKARIVFKIKCERVAATVSASPVAAVLPNGSSEMSVQLPSLALEGPPHEDSLVKVTYYWKHNDHEPGTLADLAQQRNCQPVRDWINQQVQEGRSVNQIIQATRLSLDSLLKMRTSAVVDTSIFILYDDIYNVVRRLKVERARKSTDGRESCRLWAETLAQEGWETSFMESAVLSATNEPVWVMFLLSTIGKEVLQDQHSKVWCLDSTHNAGYGMSKDQKIFLSSILVRSSVTGTGFPAAFLITPSETQMPLTHFLTWLHARVPAPTDIMIDCSTTEMAAISKTFRFASPPPRILLCQWHVLRAWEINIKEKIRVPGQDELSLSNTRALQVKCRAVLRKLMYAESPDEFWRLHAEFESEWSSQFAEFVSYFKREWATIRSPSIWAKAFRPHAHYGIDTNNYIESWHGNLKVNYLGLVRKQRVDHVLYVLCREVVPDYARRLVQCETGVEKRRLCKKEREARAKAYDLTWTELFDRVQGDVEGSIVMSSSSGTTTYKVSFDLTKCSCPAFAASHLLCKHIFMASKFIGQPIFRWKRSSALPAPPPPPPAPPSLLPIHPPAAALPPSSAAIDPTHNPAVAVSTAAVGTEANAVLEQRVLEEKEDLLRRMLQETQRLAGCLVRPQNVANGVLERTSRAQLEQVLADVTSARRLAETLF